jgi:hypothetical protein
MVVALVGVVRTQANQGRAAAKCISAALVTWVVSRKLSKPRRPEFSGRFFRLEPQWCKEISDYLDDYDTSRLAAVDFRENSRTSTLQT